MMILLALMLLSVGALVVVLRDDRPREIPRSHYLEPVTAHERWNRV